MGQRVQRGIKMLVAYAAVIALLAVLSSACQQRMAPFNINQTASGYEVQLTWDAPVSSTDPVAGYDVYREAEGVSTYILLNSQAVSVTNFSDFHPGHAPGASDKTDGNAVKSLSRSFV